MLIKRFRQHIIQEAILNKAIGKNLVSAAEEGLSVRDLGRKIGPPTVSGHHIYKSNEGNSAYYAWHPGTKSIHMSVEGSETENKNGTKTLSNLGLHAYEGNTIKAHDFYHHLIKHNNMILVGQYHSPGGKKVWQRLAKKAEEPGSGIRVHGWKPKKSSTSSSEFAKGKGVGVDIHGKPTHVPDEQQTDANRFPHMKVAKLKHALNATAQMALVAGPTKVKK